MIKYSDDMKAVFDDIELGREDTEKKRRFFKEPWTNR